MTTAIPKIPGRVSKAWERVHRDAENQILGVLAEAAEEVLRKAPCAYQEVGHNAAYLAVLNAARFAVEASAAKIAGYETWAALEAAVAARDTVWAEDEAREMESGGQ